MFIPHCQCLESCLTETKFTISTTWVIYSTIYQAQVLGILSQQVLLCSQSKHGSFYIFPRSLFAHLLAAVCGCTTKEATVGATPC